METRVFISIRVALSYQQFEYHFDSLFSGIHSSQQKKKQNWNPSKIKIKVLNFSN